MNKAPLSSLLTVALALFLVSCSGKRTPKYNPAIGPFDEDGNYIEAWADNPPKRRGGWFTNKKQKEEPEPPKVTEPAPQPRQVYNKPRTESRPKPKTTSRPKTTSKPKAQPKPKPTPVKTKPKTRRHTVKKGDTLYGLSRKYGVSVSAIQKANKLSGSNIRLGASLVIPGK